jgi:hypothetical protein
MQKNPMPEDQSGNDWTTPDREDAKWQRRVLSFLLEQYPHQLSKLEIARELLRDNPGFSERDALDRAIADLVRGGLVQLCESLILLTRAARLFASLDLN